MSSGGAIDVTSCPISAANLAQQGLPQLLELLDSLSHIAHPRDCLAELAADMRGSAGRAILLWSVSSPRSADAIIRGARGPIELVPSTSPARLLSRIAATPAPKTWHDLNLLSDETIPPMLQSFRSLIAAPVFAGGAVSDWAIVLDERPEGLDMADLHELVIRARLVSLAAEQLHITRELWAANVKAQDELQQIAEIQRALLPQKMPQIAGAEVAAWYSPVINAGGDLYDFIHLAPDMSPSAPCAILIGDVSGHGPAAAVVMAMIDSILHAAPLHEATPAKLLAHVNEHLCAKNIGGVFATALLAIYDPGSRLFSYARAGHPPAILISPDQGPRQLDAVGDLPLGISPGQAFGETTLQLFPGQTILFYTDGITEAPNGAGRFFEVGGLEASVASARGAEEAVIRARRAVSHHCGKAPHTDDQTLVALGIHP